MEDRLGDNKGADRLGLDNCLQRGSLDHSLRVDSLAFILDISYVALRAIDTVGDYLYPSIRKGDPVVSTSHLILPALLGRQHCTTLLWVTHGVVELENKNANEDENRIQIFM